jgi:hypothetical protein
MQPTRLARKLMFPSFASLFNDPRRGNGGNAELAKLVAQHVVLGHGGCRVDLDVVDQ